MIDGKGYRDQTTPVDIDIEYQNCIFSQSQPAELNGKKVGVRIFPNDETPRTFTRCNLVNCEPPHGSTLIKCNTSIIERKVSVVTDTIVIDEEEIDIVEEFDYIHGRYDPETESYIYHAEPIEVSH